MNTYDALPPNWQMNVELFSGCNVILLIAHVLDIHSLIFIVFFKDGQTG